ncbi:hypothetical protein PYW07_017452 [Mythimna separata]|uniref:Uncharacterized protein n=1 Tax=Mythimna separata TaxID=271217 RepID=A0AAD8DYL2_MYTSE|nr:hypothetical protein PYW07_017452 [Mythimna separata]
MFPEDVDQFARFHAGFGAWGRERVWTTIDGQRLENVYNNWDPTQPDNLNGNQNRGAVLKNGYIDDIGPEQLPYVCEKSPQSKRFEPLPPCMQVLKNLCQVSIAS